MGPDHSGQLSLTSVQKSSKSDARFWRYSQNVDFWPIFDTIIWRLRFFSKIRLEHFLLLSRYNFVQSFRKIWCAVFQITHTHTDRLTYLDAQVFRHLCRETKNLKNHCHRGFNILGVTRTFWVKITSKMNSAPSNYSEYKFLAKSNNF